MLESIVVEVVVAELLSIGIIQAVEDGPAVLLVLSIDTPPPVVVSTSEGKHGQTRR
jgi:hypothetical protein